MQFWSAGHDPEHPLHGSTPERYGLLRFETGCYIAIAPSDQGLMDVEWQEHAHGFPTHEAALRAVAELRRLAQGSIDVIKVGGSLLPFRSGWADRESLRQGLAAGGAR